MDPMPEKREMDGLVRLIQALEPYQDYYEVKDQLNLLRKIRRQK
jgi:hypothetical protein